MLPLEDFIATTYKTAARIKIWLPDCDFLQFVIFDYEIALKSPPASETLSSNRAWECRNLDYFVGFIDSRDVEAKLTISFKFRRMRERCGDEPLDRLDGFKAVL